MFRPSPKSSISAPSGMRGSPPKTTCSTTCRRRPLRGTELTSRVPAFPDGLGSRNDARSRGSGAVVDFQMIEHASAIFSSSPPFRAERLGEVGGKGIEDEDEGGAPSAPGRH